jgi:hypothetical protein
VVVKSMQRLSARGKLGVIASVATRDIRQIVGSIRFG